MESCKGREHRFGQNWTAPLTLAICVAVTSAALGNGGPFVLKYPNGDPAAKGAVPALIVALKDKNGRVRLSAVHALGRIGPAAKAAVPALTKALKDEYSIVRQAAEEALKKIRGEKF